MEFSRPEYWVAFPLSRRSSQLKDWTQVSHIAGGFFTSWATRELVTLVQLLSHVQIFVTPMETIARILEWVAISFSRGPSRPMDQIRVSWTGRRILYNWATREGHSYCSCPCDQSYRENDLMTMNRPHQSECHSARWVLTLSRAVGLPLCLFYVGACGLAHCHPWSLHSPWTSSGALVHVRSQSRLLTLVTSLHRCAQNGASGPFCQPPWPMGAELLHGHCGWVMVGEVIASGHKLQGRGIVRAHLDMRSGEGWQEQWRRGGDLEFKKNINSLPFISPGLYLVFQGFFSH